MARVAPALIAAVTAVVASACAGSSTGPTTPAALPAGPTAPVPAGAQPGTMAACERPADDVRMALASRLSSDVEVRQAAVVQTGSRQSGQPVVYLAGVVYRNGKRAGVAVWASDQPSTGDSWTAVDAAAQQFSTAQSAVDTAGEMSRNAADYTRVTSCATLGF